jgi:hypothetical protein
MSIYLDILDRSLHALRRLCRIITSTDNSGFLINPSAIEGQMAGNMIYEALSKDKPCMICRFGSTELDTILTYLAIHDKSRSNFTKICDFLFGIDYLPFWSYRKKYAICNFSGFFAFGNDRKIIYTSRGESVFSKFCELNINCMENIDILGSWMRAEKIIMDRMPNAKYVSLFDLEPYNHLAPWSRILKGQKILVVHPFSETIKSQYEKREKLFNNSDVLPEFQLETIKAVQSLVGNIPMEYSDWFEALEAMKKQIYEKDFDIALIGCGAYGFPLASFVKDLGKKSVHLGGALQLLFGIKGKRWETEYDYDKKFYNDYWVYPADEDKPKNFQNIEGGCYW